MLVNDKHTKACSTTCIMPFFWSHLTTFMGRINICWGLFSLTCIIFICPNMVFPPLLNIILLVGLDVLIEIIHDFLKFYLWNVVVFANRHSVTVWSEIEIQSTLLIVHSHILFIWIFQNVLLKKILRIFIFIAWMLFVLFVFKELNLVALGLNFAFLQPFGGSLVYLMANGLWYVCFQSILYPVMTSQNYPSIF